MRHFAHNIGDYAAATAHLSFVEDAAYHRCLRRYYQDEHALPGDVREVQRLVGARSKDERQAVANVLAEFFHLEDDGHHQDRADREIAAYHAKADAARENGTKGGRPRNQQKTNPVSSPVRSEKLTTPHSPLTNPEATASGERAHDGAPHGRSGTRLPEDWQPTADDRAFAADAGLDPEATAGAFRDYWRSIPGARGRKLDWPATWRNWCRRDAGTARTVGPRSARAFQSPRGNDAFFEQLADIASRDD